MTSCFAFTQIFPNYHVPVPEPFLQAGEGTGGGAGGTASGPASVGSESSRTQGETFDCCLEFVFSDSLSLIEDDCRFVVVLEMFCRR
jgi:hypothetical protein